MRVETAEESLALIESAFEDSSSEAADMIALNAGAAIYVAGIASSLQEGVQMAGDIIGSGHAKIKLQEFAEFTRMLKDVETK